MAQRRAQAFTLVEIMVVVAFIGLLVALAIPSFAKARTTALMQGCVENQRAIFDAVIQYEQDTGTTLQSISGAGGRIRQALVGNGYIKNANTFQCPATGQKGSNADYLLLYTTSGDFTNTRCRLYPAVHILP